MAEQTPVDRIPGYPLNPHYGTGVYRRRIKLVASVNDSADGGSVVGELEDCNHGFRVTVHHQHQVVTDIIGEALRIPMNTCGGAIEPVKALIGCKIDETPLQLNITANPTANCTHLLDLTVLAIAHCQRGSGERLYDVQVDDENDQGISHLRVYLDDRLIHHWQAQGFAINAPATLQGNTLLKGFAAWAAPSFSGDEQEAAFVLQKGFFVGQARRYDIDAQAGEKNLQHTNMHGSCYSYSSPRLEEAVRLPNTVRDFTNTPEQLLKFV